MHLHAGAVELVSPGLVQAAGPLGLALGLGWKLILLHVFSLGSRLERQWPLEGHPFDGRSQCVRAKPSGTSTLKAGADFNLLTVRGPKRVHGQAQHQCKEGTWKYVPPWVCMDERNVSM